MVSYITADKIRLKDLRSEVGLMMRVVWDSLYSIPLCVVGSGLGAVRRAFCTKSSHEAVVSFTQYLVRI